jgi:adenine-specific DNA-methyltransferase
MYDSEGFLCLNTIYCCNRVSNEISLKFICSIINSKLISFWFKKLFILTDKLFPYIRVSQLNFIPIPHPLKHDIRSFEFLVDCLLHLHDKQSAQLFSHIANERIASHIEAVLDMMVYELYFEEHMKASGIDVLQYIKPRPIDLNTDTEKAEAITAFYLWLQTPDNAVRQRMNVVDIKSPHILSKINSATQ